MSFGGSRWGVKRGTERLPAVGVGRGEGRWEESATIRVRGGAGLGACARKGVSSKKLLSRAGVHLGRFRGVAGDEVRLPAGNSRAGCRSRRRRDRSGVRCRAQHARDIGTGDQVARLTQIVYSRWGQAASRARGEVRG